MRNGCNEEDIHPGDIPMFNEACDDDDYDDDDDDDDDE